MINHDYDVMITTCLPKFEPSPSHPQPNTFTIPTTILHGNKKCYHKIYKHTHFLDITHYKFIT